MPSSSSSRKIPKMSEHFTKKEDTQPKAVPIRPAPVPSAPAYPGSWHSDNSGKLLITENVLELTKHFEGLVLTADDDGYGTPTIGYGRIIYQDGKKVRNGETCNASQANAWLLEDLYREGAKYVRAFLKDEIEDKLSPEEFSVWVDLSFNRGCGRFREFIASLLNAGKFETAKIQLTECPDLHSTGSYNLGLHRRRWAERFVLEGRDWRELDSREKFIAFQQRGYK